MVTGVYRAVAVRVLLVGASFILPKQHLLPHEGLSFLRRLFRLLLSFLLLLCRLLRLPLRRLLLICK